MASKQPNGRMHVFPSSLFSGRYTVHLDDHIIGVLQFGKTGAEIKRLKVGRDDEGRGIYEAPDGRLARPYDTTNAAADAVLDEWLGRAA